MRFNEINYGDGSPPIDGYGPGFFRIGGQVYQGAITVLPRDIQPWSGYDDTARFNGADIDVLLVGTGADIHRLPKAFCTVIETAGIGVEMMSSPAACRTYNILLSEGRRIGLALFAV